MSKPVRATLALALGTISLAASAADFGFEQTLFFNAANQNPFKAGDAWKDSKTFDLTLPISRTEVPAFRLPSAGPLYLEAGGRTEGKLGIQLVTQLSSGLLDLAYPMRSTITAPTADSVKLGDSFRLSLAGTAPTSGVFKVGDVFSSTAAISVGDMKINAGGGTGLVQPFIRTTFPQLSAQLNLSFEQKNSAYLQGCADALIKTFCKDIGTLNLPSIGPIKQTIASLDPSGIRVLPGTPFEAGVKSGEPIPVFSNPLPGFGPYGTLTPTYPTLTTRGTMVSDNGPLKSNDAQSILELKVYLDRLLSDFVLTPALLPPLSGPLGPAKYTLLEATASLSANVYQNFDYQPQLGVRLDFNQPMRLASGGPAFYSITTNAGAPLDLKPVNLFQDKVTVRPTYLLGGTLESVTGLGFEAGIDVRALRIQLGDLDSGFAFQDGASSGNIPVVELYRNRFTPVVPEIQGDAFVLDFQQRFTSFKIEATAFGTNGGARFTTEYLGGSSSVFGSRGRFVTADGRLVTGSDHDRPVVEGAVLTDVPIFFVSDTDILDFSNGGSTNLGRVFCYVCFDQALPTRPDATLLTLLDGTKVLANPETDPMAWLALTAPAPLLADAAAFDAGGFTAFAPGEVPPQFQWLQTPAVPEPSAAWLMLAGLGLFGAARRLRRRPA